MTGSRRPLFYNVIEFTFELSSGRLGKFSESQQRKSDTAIRLLQPLGLQLQRACGPGTAVGAGSSDAAWGLRGAGAAGPRYDQGGSAAATGSLSGAGNVKVDRRITLDMIRGEGLGRRDDNKPDWVKARRPPPLLKRRPASDPTACCRFDCLGC